MKITHEELLQIIKEELEGVLEERCQKGYVTHKTRKTKKMFGRTYRNCVKPKKKKLKSEQQELDELATLEQQELEEKKKRKKRKKRKKAGTESGKESSLRDWFGRKGAKGKKKGWVDCNAPDGDGGYKSCGRSGKEKRKKYPACRPTPGACKERGRGSSWGKKSKKRGKKK